MDNSKITTQRELFDALHGQYRKKNAAYGNSAHETFEEWGEIAYLVRISDKLHRMNQLIETPLTDDIGESILDTIGDCITYMIMLLADREAADYAINGRTYEDAVEDTFASFERGYKGVKHWGRIDIDDLCRTWKESNFDNNYHPLREMIADLAFQWLLRARFHETWDTDKHLERRHADGDIIVQYHADIPRLEHHERGDWVDLYAAETVDMKAGEYRRISLGVSMWLPDGYEAHVLPRSSTPERWGIICANSEGIIDSNYNGSGDVWQFPALAMRDTHIEMGDRIAQFRIVPVMQKTAFAEADRLPGNDRGGFGSTGAR